jgi:hypothetical protein
LLSKQQDLWENEKQEPRVLPARGQSRKSSFCPKELEYAYQSIKTVNQHSKYAQRKNSSKKK